MAFDWNGRREPRTVRLEDERTEAQVDYARIIHSASFRRLQGKTQILNLGDSDFYRTRLTHSLEVAQVARGITQQFASAFAEHPGMGIQPDADLVQAIGLTHDLGHPPFGHGGEVALNYCMREAGGFEGNGQTLRILGRLEKYSDLHGANLTRRTMLGILKYPAPYSRVVNPDLRPRLAPGGTVVRFIDRKVSKPPKCYLDCDQDVVDWVLDGIGVTDRERFTAVAPAAGKHAKPLHKSFDCSIMDLADDIGFGVHDLEDAIALGLLSRDTFSARIGPDLCDTLIARLDRLEGPAGARSHYEGLLDALFGRESDRKRGIGLLVNHFISEAAITTDDHFETPLLRYKAGLPNGARAMLDGLIDVVYEHVIASAAVQQLEFKGQAMVVAVFEALSCDPARLLPEATRKRHDAQADEGGRLRVICDHIAGMTDGFLLRTYERLFSPRMGSVFDRL